METATSLEKVKSSGRDALLNVLDQAGDALASSSGIDSSLRTRLIALQNRLRDERLQIAVLGQFKRGKSTFLNALLGAPLLPTGVVPLTAVVTFIAWGEEPSIHVHFSDGRPGEQFMENCPDVIRQTLSRFVTEEANPKNRLGIERVDLFYRAEILAGGTVLIDTPGIGSTLAHNTETALRVLPECDASLFVASADPPITEMELNYLHRLQPKIGRIFFVVNKLDYLNPDEQLAVSDFLRKVLTENSLIDPQTRIFGVSARLGLAAAQDMDGDAWKQSGMAEIETHLLRYLATEKMSALCEAIRRKATDILSNAEGKIELAAKALKMPLHELERKVVAFSETLRSIEAQRLTISDLVSGERRRLIGDLESQIRYLRTDLTARLARVIEDALSGRATTSDESTKSVISVAIEDHFGKARERLVAAFSKQAADVLSNHRLQIEALVDEVRRTAAEMFELRFVPCGDIEAFRLVQEPYWVTESIVSMSGPVFNCLTDRFLPDALRGRLRQRRMIKETSEMVVRNAENLRWAILRGLDEMFRGAAAQLEDKLADASNATKGVIEDALKRRHDRSFAAETALVQFERSTEKLAAIERSLHALRPRV